MGKIKATLKKTRLQRLTSTNQSLLSKLATLDKLIVKYQEALLNYADESNWYFAAPDEANLGIATTISSRTPEWHGPGNGPSLARNCLKENTLREVA